MLNNNVMFNKVKLITEILGGLSLTMYLLLKTYSASLGQES